MKHCAVKFAVEAFHRESVTLHDAPLIVSTILPASSFTSILKLVAAVPVHESVDVSTSLALLGDAVRLLHVGVDTQPIVIDAIS